MAFTKLITVRRSTLVAPRLLARPSILPRTFASKSSQDATASQASPGTSSNVANPSSSSADEQSLKQSRGTDSAKGSSDTASVQTPVSDPKGAGTGQQEDDTGTQQVFKQDPGKPDGEKREAVEEMGRKKLDAGDK